MANWWNDNSSAVVSAGSGIVSGAINAITSSVQNKKNREFAREEAEKQRDWQEEMWNKENEYNTPANQAARLRAAGFNPYAMGDVDSTSMSVGSGSTASTPPTTPIDFGFIKDSAMSFLSTKIQKEQLNQMRQQTQSIYLDNVKKAFENGNLSEVYEYQKRLLDDQLKLNLITHEEHRINTDMLNLAYNQAKDAADSGINPHVDAHNESVQRVIESESKTLTENLTRMPLIAQMRAKTALDNLAYELDNKYGREIIKADAKTAGVAYRKAVEEFNEYVSGRPFRERMLSAGASSAEADAVVRSLQAVSTELDLEYLKSLVGDDGDWYDVFGLLVYGLVNQSGVGLNLSGSATKSLGNSK